MAEDTNAATDTAAKATKGRDSRPLPAAVSKLTVDDFGLFDFGDEMDRNDTDAGLVRVATSVKVKELKDGKEVEVVYQLMDFTVDNLREIAKKMDVQGYASASKFTIRRLLARRSTTANRLAASRRIDSADKIKKRINSQLRLTNAVSHKDAIDLVVVVNDNKNRKDHEAKKTPKQTWMDVADIYNDASPDDDLDTVILPPGGCSIPFYSEHKDLLVEDDEVDPSDFNPVESDGKYVAKIVNKMFRVRTWIKRLLDDSGRNCPDPFAYISTAMKRANVKEIYKLPAYYFYIKCEQHKDDLEARFSPFMNENLKGSSEDMGEIVVTTRKKKQGDDESVASLAKEIFATMKQEREEKKAATVGQAFGVKEAIAILNKGCASPNTTANCKKIVKFAASEAVEAVEEAHADKRRRLSFGDEIEVGSVTTATSTLRGSTSVTATSSSSKKTVTAEDLTLELDGDDEDEDDDDVSSDGIVL